MSNGNAYGQQWPLIKGYLHEKMELGEVEPTKHAKQRMDQRKIDRSDIAGIVRLWNIDEMYEPYSYPYGDNARTNKDPVFSITGYDTLGRKVTVAFALKRQHRELWFEIVTVFFEDEKVKNRHQSKTDNQTF